MRRLYSLTMHSGSLIGVLAATILALSAFAGCDKTVAVTGIRLDKTSLALTEGESANLVATVEPATATNGAVTWTSTNASVASVNNGLVKALKEGSTTVTVTTADGGKTATCSVTVKSAKIAVTGIALDKTSLTLTEGESNQLTATVTPANATDPSVSWSSSDAAIASVDKSGKVTAVKAGTANITVTTTDGDKKDVCLVAVKAAVVNVTGVALDKASASLLVGQTQQLKATVSPDNATDKTVSWSSSNPNVASVDENGYVTGKASGSATVTVVTTDGGKMATCDFTVTQPVTGVSLDKASLSIVEGESATLTATVAPADATNKEVAWSTSDASIVTVEATASGSVSSKSGEKESASPTITVKLTAVKEGSAKITVTTKDGDKTAECVVTVSKKIISVAGVELNKKQLNLETGASETLIAAVSPTNATDKSITWSTSAPEVATVSDNGKVTAVKAGDAVITVKTTDGGKMASCDVTVADKVVKPTGITVTPSTLALIVGQTGQLTAAVAPADATDKSVKWTSSNSNIATVDELGKVTAVSGGVVTIVATTNSGDLSASCDVKVTQPVSGIKLDKSEVTLVEGETATLTATIEPKDASDKTVTWSTGDANTATVEDASTSGTISAKVTAVKAGTVKIAVTTKDGGKTAECAVTVKPAKVAVTGISLDKTSETIAVGATLQLTATVKPGDATDKSVTWSSSDPAVAEVDANGLVSAKATGETTITVTTTDGGKMATCDVTVKGMGINIPDANFKAYLVANFDKDGDKEISLDEAEAVKEIDCSEKNIASLEGIQYFTSLTSLDCGYNQLTSLDVSKNTALTELYCDNNQLTALDVSKNTALTELRCSYNQLTSLDISKNTALTELSCDSNQLTALDVSKNTALTELYCYSNQLTALDVSKNTALTYLSCYGNQLTSLDISKNTALTYLSCYGNQLSSLDASTMVTPGNYTLVCGQQKTSGGSDATLNLTLDVKQKARWSFLYADSYYGKYETNVNVTFTGSETVTQSSVSVNDGEVVTYNTGELSKVIAGKTVTKLVWKSGSINGTDVAAMRTSLIGTLEYADMKNVKIVAGGDAYQENNYSYSTDDDVFPQHGLYGFTQLATLILPSSIKEIGGYSCMQCYSLTSIEIPDSVKIIDFEAFYGDRNLASISLNSGLEYIRGGAFGAGTLITSLTIPSSVKRISADAFSDASQLTTVNIGSGLESTIGVFSDCDALASMTIDPTNTHIKLAGNFVVDYATGSEIQSCLRGNISGMLEIPAGIKTIADDAFRGCSITSVSFPEGLASIGSYSFGHCRNLTGEITLPASLNSLNSLAFPYSNTITSFTVKATTPPAIIESYGAFSNCNKLTAIYVPAASVDAYKAADGWKARAGMIKAMP